MLENKALKIIGILIFFTKVHALDFGEIVKRIEGHDEVVTQSLLAKSLESDARVAGSWGDPMFKVAAKNFPKDDLSRGKTPMTGIEFGIASKISLTTKYQNLEDAKMANAKSEHYISKDRKNGLMKVLWDLIISEDKVKEEIRIIKESLKWISDIIKVSQKLYGNGRISQQALLELQIRKSELESSLSNKTFELEQLNTKSQYLFSSNLEEVNKKSIPWKILDQKQTVVDFKQLAIEKKLEGAQLNLTAAKLNYVPDLTVSLGYTKRENIDGKGDFLGASVSFPLPFSSQKYGNHNKAIEQKSRYVKMLNSYERGKERDKSYLTQEISKLSREKSILSNKTIKFATDARRITSKSYAIGNASYIELLQSELNLQKLLLKEVSLNYLLKSKKIQLKNLLGEKLHE